MRENSAQNSTDEQKRRRSRTAVPLGVLEGKEILIREEIAVDAGQDDAGQGVVLESSARHGLATALEGDECKRRQDRPADMVLVLRGGRKGDDEGGGDDEERLGGKGHAEHPSPLGRKVTVEAGEEE